MPQVSRRTATRRASSRSGETSAAVRPGVSAASRRMSAMVSASSCADGASMRLTPASALRTSFASAVAMYCCQRPVMPDGRMASAMSPSRVSPAALRSAPRSCCTSARSTPRAASSLAKPNCGCSGCSAIAAQLSASRCRSRPGSTMAPCGSRATARHELHRRRHRAGDAGDDHGTGRRRVAEALGLGEDGLVAPRGRRQQLLLGEIRRPEGGDDLEELERALPVLGVFVRHQRGEAVERHVLGLDHVHQARELGGEMRRLRRRVGARRRGVLAEVRGIAGIAADGLRPALHQHRQDKAALDLAHRRRKVERVGAERAGAGEAGQQRQILIAGRDRPDLRQRHRAPARSGEEGILHGAGRTSRRQQQRDVGKLQRARRTAARRRQVAAQDRRGNGLRETAVPPVR